MNRASKSVLIYLALERQLSNANGDASKTVNSLANQMRIFKEQITMAARQVGAVFIPVLRTILPIANAILMVFNELMNMLLALLGVDASDMAKEFGIGTSSVLDMTDQVDNLGSSIGGATKKAKELKLSLRGFDKLNNITTPTEASASGGGGVGIGGALSGVDSRLLDALKEYDLHLDSISNKAVQIKDSIMEWLGFSKDTNGEWEFSHVTLGTILGLIAGGAGIYSFVSKILGFVGTIGTHMGDILGKVGFMKPMLKGLSGLEIFGLVAGTVTSLIGIYKTITGIIDLIKDPSIVAFKQTLEGISLYVLGLAPIVAKLTGSGIVGVVMGIVGALGLLASSLIDTRTDAERLRDVQKELNDAQQEYINASKTHLNAYNNFEKARKKLIDVGTKLHKNEQEIKKAGEELYNEIREGTKSVEKLSDEDRMLYEAYIDYIDSDNQLAKANDKVTESYKSELNAIINEKEELARQSKTLEESEKAYSEYATAVQNAYNNNAISLNQYSTKMGQIYNSLDENSKEVFLNSIPKYLQEPVKQMAALERATTSTGGTLNLNFNKAWKVQVDTSTANKNIEKLQSTFNNFKSNLLKPLKIALSGSVVTGGITTRASGGFVNTGELYIANENGTSEMIGKIGNQPAVANNDQIIEGISIGVAKAMQSVKANQPIVVKADANTSGLLNFINFEQEKRNRQYGL